MKKGIGITTFCKNESRFSLIKTFFESFLDINKNITKSYEIYVSDDNSTYEKFPNFLNSLAASGIHILRNKRNVGVAANTNRLLKIFAEQQFDIIFKLEDDNLFLKDGLFDIYSNLLIKSKQNHFSFVGHNYFDVKKDPVIEEINGFKVQTHRATNGVFLCFTKKVLNEIGGYTVAPEKWGGGHIDFSKRCFFSNNTTDYFPDFLQSNEYFRITDIGEKNSNFSHSERAYMGSKNLPFYQEQITKKGLYRELITLD